MSKFYPLHITEVKRETPEAVSVSFAIPSELASKFAYKQGQYITFKLQVEGQEIRRSYSICSCPYTDSFLQVAIKEVQGGKGSTFLNRNIKAGDVLEVMEPMGTFNTPLHASNKLHYVLFAGGSGITPMMSIIKSVLHIEKQSRITLVYGNLNEEAVIFKDQLDALASAHPQLQLVHVLQKPMQPNFTGYQGIMDTGMVEKIMADKKLSGSDCEYFICGPTPMMQGIESLLKKQADAARIHLEYFTAPVSETAVVSSNAPVACKATIVCDGEERVIEINPGQNVLDAALDANIDAPYACQGGSCCTCRALLTEGKVEMKVNYALLESEVAEGYILTCQALPLTPSIRVDYDRGR
jgi:ring-1,2-phenylacetyl-CoA epoxidase subunit PaaE